MQRLRFLFVPLACLTCAAATLPSASDWTVRNTSAMSTPRAAHQATALGAGAILLTGGCSGSGCSPVEQSAEIFNTALGTSVPTKPMKERRVSHIAAPLIDGRVLVAGGWTGERTTASAEIFDQRAGTFSPAGAMATPRMDATATPLRDGSVLVIGGATATNRPVAQSEIFSSTDGRFRAAAAMAEARAHHAAVRLADGRVLVVGGMRAPNLATRSAEIYDPATKRFETTGAMMQARCKHAAVVLEDGRVMVIAGSSDCDDRKRIAQTEIYDPATGTFSAGPTLLNPRYKIVGAAAVLPGGEVVIAGDADDVEVWTPGQSHFTKANGGIGKALSFSVATPLANGEVFVTGGYTDDIQVTAQTWRVNRERRASRRD